MTSQAKASVCSCQLGCFKQAILWLIVGTLSLLVVYQLLEPSSSLSGRVPALTQWSSESQGHLLDLGGVNVSLNSMESEADWRTTFYNVTSGKIQALWSWPLEEDGTPVAVRNISVVILNAPHWLRVDKWHRQLRHRRCPVPCVFSFDRSQAATADGVVFHAVKFPMQPPPTRPPGQTWVMFIMEPPPLGWGANLDSEGWEHQINWTMTYRQDSDIWSSYGRFHRRHEGETKTNLTGTDRKLVAWVVSNCHALSRRNEYVGELQKHILVDIYGGCGTLSCGQECAEVVGRSYRFYLAFENNLCEDYFTEKVSRYMSQPGVIPVVRGGANYTRYLPPGSYIDTADFPSPKALAEHLKRVAASPALQESYFAWRQQLQVEIEPPPACELCVRLLRPQSFPKTYPASWHWFSGTSPRGGVSRDPCRAPTDV